MGSGKVRTFSMAIKAAAFMAVVFLSSASFGTTHYYFQSALSGMSPTYHNNESEACAAGLAHLTKPPAAPKGQKNCLLANSQAKLTYTYWTDWGGGEGTWSEGESYVAQRFSFECPQWNGDPLKTEYKLDRTTGPTCIKPVTCDDTAGEIDTFQTYLGNEGENPLKSIPSSTCEGGCKQSLVSNNDCWTQKWLTGAQAGKKAIFCNVSYISTAETCSVGPESPQNPTDDSPAGDKEPKDPDAPDCPPGFYSVKSGASNICNQLGAKAPGPNDEGCPPGTDPGTVNGISVCVAGTNTGGEGDGEGGGDGPCVPTPTDPCDGTGDGTGGGDGEGPCVPTPTDPCDGTGDGTGGGGGDNGGGDGSAETAPCEDEDPPECEGDALACANLQQIWETGCETVKALSVDDEVSDEADESLEGLKTKYAEEDGAFQAAMNTISGQFRSAMNRSANGPCFPNVNVSVMGKSVTVPYTTFCDYFQFLRMLVLLFAYYRAMRIVYEAF